MEQERPILFEKRGAVGLITLNRPRALNALTQDMCLGLQKMLAEWARDDGVKAVAIRGAGPRAFCAGGDIRAMYESNIAGTPAAADFLADEYRLNAMIGAYPKPYVALTHGIVMGGGAGVSVHGSHRLADATLDFAMPESGIGFVTDIGATHFLSRCPGAAGFYLGLTGARIGLADAISLGLFTHAVKTEDHDAVIEKLASGAAPGAAIAPFAFKPGAPKLAAEGDWLTIALSAASVEAILERLDRDGGDFATATAAILRRRSPSALKFIFRALREARGKNLADCLKMEYRIASRAVMAHDFREGVRATLIDKDGKPRWKPASLAGVSDADIAGYFAPLGARELSLPGPLALS
jgi:enoyl-CoA hydratase